MLSGLDDQRRPVYLVEYKQTRGRHLEKKLKSLLAEPASSGVMTTVWLRQNGISSQLVSKYVRSGWLSSIGHGAYVRDVSRIVWQHGLNALQTQLAVPVWLGGLSALALHGLGHQLAIGRERVWLHAQDSPHLPKWFNQHDWSVDFVLINRRLFVELPNDRFIVRESGGVSLTVARPEQAVLEYLDRVQSRSAFEDAADLMAGTRALRPKLMQSLLESCRSIRAKRLALYFADTLQLPWMARLDLSNIDLGSGPRQIVADGRLDSTYQITVPRSLEHGI